MKQAIVARRDLGMGPGKLAAQVAHAAVAAADTAPSGDRDSWRQAGQLKVVLGVDDLSALQEVAGRADAAGLPTATIRDAGRTELAPDTVTVVGIGPAADDRIDAITGDLDLY